MAASPAAIEALRARNDLWEPAGDGSIPYCTHRLRAAGEERMEFRATLLALVSCGSLVVFGIGVAATAALVPLGILNVDGGSPLGTVLFLLGMGAISGTVGWIRLRTAREPLVFDRRSGRHWRGRLDPGLPASSRKREPVALGAVRALQLLEKRVRRRSLSYVSCELNLVLENGQRVNVLDHAKKAVLALEAEALAGFLGLPVLEGESRARG